MKIFEKQVWHFISLVILACLAYYIMTLNQGFTQGEFIGISTEYWFWMTLGSAVLHQIYVLIFWRLELHYKYISKIFGKKGFTVYASGFIILIISRPVLLTLLAISNANTLIANNTLVWVLSGICIFFAVYLGYSVARYFGCKRAMGLDHFDDRFVNVAFVKKGIFKYTNNGMYLFGFFGLYIPGLLLFSSSALVAAFISHLYIWVHFYTTEKPDFKHIYKKSR